MKTTKIDWCDCTLNPVIGCTFGCTYCYAKKINDRFHFVEDYSKPQFFPDRLKALNCKTPKTIFMDSMSDIADWKRDWIKQTLEIIVKNPQHRYLFLTKRPIKFIDTNKFMYQNIWFGCSICTKTEGHCLADEIQFMQGNKFASIEPILEDLAEFIDWDVFKWVIIGAETGNRKDKVIPKKEWVDNIIAQCKEQNIPVFMKSSIKELMGNDFIQEFPW